MRGLRRWCAPAAAALLSVSCLGAAPRAATGAPRPNVVLIVVDDLRPSLGCYGDAAAVTPNLDRLAAEGVRFDRAYTQFPLCNPARTSIMTGMQPSQTGVFENNVPWYERVDPAITLPAVLKAADVYVAMYGKHFHDHAISGAARALMFDEFLPRGGDGNPAQVISDGVKHDFPFRSGRYGGDAGNLPAQLALRPAGHGSEDRRGGDDRISREMTREAGAVRRKRERGFTSSMHRRPGAGPQAPSWPVPLSCPSRCAAACPRRR